MKGRRPTLVVRNPYGKQYNFSLVTVYAWGFEPSIVINVTNKPAKVRKKLNIEPGGMACPGYCFNAEIQP